MGFFGAFFAGVTLIAKGISKGRDAIEDSRLKKRSADLGQDTYRDHKGILHDASGRAICYYTDPRTGHRLIQDAYTLQTIRDLTAEENFERISKAKEEAKANGDEYYVYCDWKENEKALGRSQWCKLKNKYNWGHDSRIKKRKKDQFGMKTDKWFCSLDNVDFLGKSSHFSDIYSKEDEPLKKYILEDYSGIKTYTDLQTGMIVEIKGDEKTKDMLNDLGVNEGEFIQIINEKKEAFDKYYGKVPMSVRFM